MGVIDGKTICQVALVVKDLEKTTEEYAKLFGVPKPEIFRVPEESVAHTQFKGMPSKTRAKLAVFNLGQVVLELTEPDEEPSSWKDFLEKNGDGIHHIAFMTDDRDAAVNTLRKTICQSAITGNMRAGITQSLTAKKNWGHLYR